MTKLKNTNCDKTQFLTKLKNLNCEKTQKPKFWKKNSNCEKKRKKGDNTWKLKLWQNYKTKLEKKILTNYLKKTQKMWLWQNSNIQIVTVVIGTLVTVVVIVTYFS